MTEQPAATRRAFLWERSSQPPPGEVLAALRRGIGREPGTVAAMWRFYTRLDETGRLSPHLRAEHLALCLFGVHQQSKVRVVHVEGDGLGAAMRRLRQSGRYSEDAVDRRFGATATASSLPEVAVHLRGLITQLRALEQPGLDYNRLFWDLVNWQDPERVHRVRRAWGAGYFAPARRSDPTSEGTTSS